MKHHNADHPISTQKAPAGSIQDRYQLIMKQETDRFEQAINNGEPAELELFYSPAPSEKDVLAISKAFKRLV
ncbi:MAG: hypothetical protein FJX92_08865 [Bacteroidetes bacterium]|nr:hypothetical protein [Bacteroidota bacterium]